MTPDEQTLNILNNVSEIFVSRYEDIASPEMFMPDTMEVSRIRVLSSVAVDADGMIFAKLYGMPEEHKTQIVAMIEVGHPTSVTFYVEGREPAPAIIKSRRFCVFIRHS